MLGWLKVSSPVDQCSRQGYNGKIHLCYNRLHILHNSWTFFGKFHLIVGNEKNVKYNIHKPNEKIRLVNPPSALEITFNHRLHITTKQTPGVKRKEDHDRNSPDNRITVCVCVCVCESPLTSQVQPSGSNVGTQALATCSSPQWFRRSGNISPDSYSNTEFTATRRFTWVSTTWEGYPCPFIGIDDIVQLFE